MYSVIPSTGGSKISCPLAEGRYQTPIHDQCYLACVWKDLDLVKNEISMGTRTFIVAICAVAVLITSTISVLADDPVSSNREAVVKCLLKMAARAQEYYRIPVSEGGGGGSFANMILVYLTTWPATADGSFVLYSATATSIVLAGIGIETGFDGSSPTGAVLTVYADSVSLVITN